MLNFTKPHYSSLCVCVRGHLSVVNLFNSHSNAEIKLKDCVFIQKYLFVYICIRIYGIFTFIEIKLDKIYRHIRRVHKYMHSLATLKEYISHT